MFDFRSVYDLFAELCHKLSIFTVFEVHLTAGPGESTILLFSTLFRENNLSFKFADLRQTSGTFDSLDNRAAENKTFCDIFLSLLKISTFSEAKNDLFLFSLKTIAEAQIKQRIERLSGEWKNVSGQKTS